MKRIALLSVLLLPVLLVAASCGAEPEPTAEVASALIPAPYICPGQTDVNPWPNEGNCYWQPSSPAGAPHVQVCTATGQDWGFVHLYSGVNFTGACAAVWANSETYIVNADLEQLNGWLTFTNQIRSFKVGPGHMPWGGMLTSVKFSSGPDPQNNAYHSLEFPNPTSSTLAYADALAYTGHVFAGPIYSFALVSQ